ncbi:hypothetical protein AA23498_0826 [Acetobacter nitrogenifigens DSM 23921 = NBRC 105050]|uniref:Uncharacterized protein n=1 Tax=Acetobacter nitrogenifigens DSM 23921 = NBRC 105050 TaxID=1120919 RepID=A0A511XFA4_9PROT|nr:hypothetical protein AA23498_0826 [Acetobacter nitrogenifigens DSM 23921 = NBRC 105050]GEN61629.1 hypothetical protein ANI02nite_35130 [Acetobacter nitrogenifigens DSM 23921 = NBRC 105050]
MAPFFPITTVVSESNWMVSDPVPPGLFVDNSVLVIVPLMVIRLFCALVPEFRLIAVPVVLITLPSARVTLWMLSEESAPP